MHGAYGTSRRCLSIAEYLGRSPQPARQLVYRLSACWLVMLTACASAQRDNECRDVPWGTSWLVRHDVSNKYQFCMSSALMYGHRRQGFMACTYRVVAFVALLLSGNCRECCDKTFKCYIGDTWLPAGPPHASPPANCQQRNADDRTPVSRHSCC
jgi:hypothetical protein